jgi:hypothetical protein
MVSTAEAAGHYGPILEHLRATQADEDEMPSDPLDPDDPLDQAILALRGDLRAPS